jgi:LPPG:FO 2-phospho-L-lactate transferase
LVIREEVSKLKVVALAGGVGGARLVDGLAQCLPPSNLTVIVNIGDDFEHLELKICPDLDTVCYTLAGIANPTTGWGLANETWNSLDQVTALGGPGWFRLGDRDLGTHLERTRRLIAGERLSQVTRHFCEAWGVNITVLPASDDSVPTRVYTDIGDMSFQEYFVYRQCEPVVHGFSFEGSELAHPAPGVLDAFREADIVILCPSNPWVSLDPILAIRPIRQVISERLVVGVSPIIGGKAVKGPAAKMFAELGIQPSAEAVANHYQDLLDALFIDWSDEDQSDTIRQMGVIPQPADILMREPADRRRLAEEVLDFSLSVLKKTAPERRPPGVMLQDRGSN